VAQGGKLIVFHRLGAKETVDCLEANSGKPVWHFDYPTAYQDDFGFDEGPRATPAIDHDKVYAFGAEGALHCLSLQSGARLWSHQTKDEFHAQKGFFGIACSPLIVGNHVLLNAGGTDGAGVIAFDKNTGTLAWKATEDEASYSSGVLANLGAPRALFFTRSGLVGLNPDDGKVRFTFPWRSRSHASVNAATPLVVSNLVFLSASYGTGAILLQIDHDQPRKLWASDDVLSNHYATSVYKDGFLYGFHGRQESGPAFRCVELRTGKVRWSQEPFGAGTVTLAGARLLILKEDGQLLLVCANPDRYQELDRAQILSNGVRAYPAVADGLLFARSKDKLVCVDLRP
jgi:outer membrane protein assembly factor BamB